jgi:hypothetical protein
LPFPDGPPRPSEAEAEAEAGTGAEAEARAEAEADAGELFQGVTTGRVPRGHGEGATMSYPHPPSW